MDKAASRIRLRKKGADEFLKGFKRDVFRASQTYRETLHGNSYAFTG